MSERCPPRMLLARWFLRFDFCLQGFEASLEIREEMIGGVATHADVRVDVADRRVEEGALRLRPNELAPDLRGYEEKAVHVAVTEFRFEHAFARGISDRGEER